MCFKIRFRTWYHTDENYRFSWLFSLPLNRSIKILPRSSREVEISGKKIPKESNPQQTASGSPGNCLYRHMQIQNPYKRIQKSGSCAIPTYSNGAASKTCISTQPLSIILPTTITGPATTRQCLFPIRAALPIRADAPDRNNPDWSVSSNRRSSDARDRDVRVSIHPGVAATATDFS